MFQLYLSYLPLHVVANGHNGTLRELQQTHYLARHHIHGSLWHHAHALMLSGAAKHMAALSKVGGLLHQFVEENSRFTLWGSGGRKKYDAIIGWPFIPKQVD